jgi:hypothetical protein
MSTTLPRDRVSEALALVSRIDLAPINAKLRHDDPSFWTEERVAETELDYRRFLALNLVHPEVSLSVNQALDDYWHQHILDTRKYAEDCETLFGRMLHHYPYFGLSDEAEWQENLDQFADTQQLWEDTFGVKLVDEPELTLDKPIGTYQEDPDGTGSSQIYAFPKACKSGQHCQKIIGPDRIDPRIRPLPEEPAKPLREPFGPPETPRQPPGQAS